MIVTDAEAYAHYLVGHNTVIAQLKLISAVKQAAENIAFELIETEATSGAVTIDPKEGEGWEDVHEAVVREIIDSIRSRHIDVIP